MAIIPFDQLSAWKDPAVAKRLGWYLDVAENRKPAKFRIARTIPVALSLADAPEDALWDELDRLTPVFVERLARIRETGEAPGTPPPHLLDLCRELAYRMLAHCNFCRWNCRVDRTRGTKFGTCKLGSDTRVSTYFHHLGEELVYRGLRGSGTIFFTSCNMRCAFCQNGDISTDKDNGMVADARTLATMAWLLRMEGCHNINWVGGEVTIHLHTVVDAIALLGGEMARPDNDDVQNALRVKSDPFTLTSLVSGCGTYAGAFNAPMLWNSNFFMTAEAMKILRILMDVWLPDFKFGPGRCAITLSRTPRYWETVTENLALIHRWGEDFTIRHLVMPNHVECCTYPVLDWIAETMPDVPVNIMDQYHPDTYTDPCNPRYEARYADIARRLTGDEVRDSYRYAERLGLKYETITHEKNTLGLFV
ncbi:MAG: pyruvate formate lyase activating enzyme [Proteobacteria bacterium]|nr:pyruvate formate lyase activating enzyme [Pseudomonadota bacterium]